MKQPSVEEVAQAVEQVKEKNIAVDTKELIQFKGERTPQATIMPLQPERPARVDPIVPTGRPVQRAPSNDEGLLQSRTPAATIRTPDH